MSWAVGLRRIYQQGGRDDTALNFLPRLRDSGTDPGKKLTVGLLHETYVAGSREAGDHEAKFQRAFGRRMLRKIRALCAAARPNSLEPQTGLFVFERSW